MFTFSILETFQIKERVFKLRVPVFFKTTKGTVSWYLKANDINAQYYICLSKWESDEPKLFLNGLDCMHSLPKFKTTYTIIH